MNVVISQSMLFPWVGMLEQIRLADAFVHYDDVQFSKGSFTNRVQIKTAEGIRWLTIPLEGLKLGQRIDSVVPMPKSSWQDKHMTFLKQSLKGAPFLDDALDLVRSVYGREYTDLGALSRQSMLALAGYFGLLEGRRWIDVTSLDTPGASSQRVLEIVRAVQGTDYITGHGAKNYLDHTLLEGSGIRTAYMKYRCMPYAQLHGAFTPYVSGLDLVANCGPEGVRYICSQAVYWKEFLNESH